MKLAQPGSISHGTLRLQDLIDAFTSELESLVQDNADAWCSDAGRVQRDGFMTLIGNAREIEPHADPDVADELVTELIDALGTFAPEGCSFGAHEGDGSDFGYWPNDDDNG